ncbi:MAG: hypothetical protein ACFFDT_00300 [Candidatus Hodarchaeota archaeon]
MKIGKMDYEWKLWKIIFYFKWYDLYIGPFVKPDLTRLYFNLLPTLGFYINLKKKDQ